MSKSNKLYITYSPFNTACSVPDALAEDRARDLVKRFEQATNDVYKTFSNALVIDWIRLLIHRGSLDHTRVVLIAPPTAIPYSVIMNEENCEQITVDKNGRYNSGTGPVCYHTTVLSGLLDPNPWDL